MTRSDPFQRELSVLRALLGRNTIEPSWQSNLLVAHRHKVLDLQRSCTISRLDLVDDGVLVHLDSIRFVLSSNDDFFVAWEIFHGRCYELSDFSRPVLDIGANVGLSALYFLLEGAPFVACFEPNPEAYARLTRNLGMNAQFSGRYSLSSCAVWNQPGTQTARLFSSHPACGHLIDDSVRRLPPEAASAPLDIEVATIDIDCVLDDLVTETRFDRWALKMDCEGSELTILERLVSLHRTDHFDEMVIETHDGSSGPILTLLEDESWRLEQRISESSTLAVLRLSRVSQARKPQVSVVIPAYNAAQTLPETVHSILTQTYRDLELIIVDDGSTDQTSEIIAKIVDPRVRSVRIENQGQAGARNAGIALARGRFIGFCDADDVWLPRKVQRQLRTLKRHPDCAMTHSWAISIDEAGDSLRLGGTVAVKGDVFVNLYVANFFECGSTALVTRSALDTVGPFDVTVNRSEDWDMWLRIALRFGVASTPFVDVLYRQSRSSQSSHVSKIAQTCYRVLATYRERVPPSLCKVAYRNIAMYLAFKAVEANISVWHSLRFLLPALQKAPLFFLSVPKASRVVVRLLGQALLPRGYLEFLCRHYPSWLSADALLGAVKEDTRRYP